MSIRGALAVFVTVGICNATPSTTWAGYPANPAINMPVTTAPTSQFWKDVISDGIGGAFVAWEDTTSGNRDIYVQKLDIHGNRLWSPVNGREVSAWTGDQILPQMAADGAGGVTVVWTDLRNGDTNPDIYFEWIQSDGFRLSGGVGFVVCDHSSAQYLEDVLPQPVSVIGTPPRTVCIWNDERTDGGDLYLQIMDGAGDPTLIAGGVPVSLASNVQAFASMAEIGTAGVVIVWRDFRPTSGVSGGAIYAQRFDGTSMRWTTDGIPVSPTLSETQQFTTVVSSLDNYAVVVWMGFDNLFLPTVYAQRLDQNGITQWGAGVRVSEPGGAAVWPIAVEDGAGGVYIAWLVDGQSHVQAQRIDSNGNALWGTWGVAVMTTANVMGGFGGEKLFWTDLVRTSMGVIVPWSDDRNGISNVNVFAQHLSSVTGDIWANWPAEGLRVCSHVSYSPRAITDHSSGAVIAWQDQRNSPTRDDIYAQGVNFDGSLGDGATGVGDIPQLGPSVASVPNPFSSSALISYTMTSDGYATLDVFDVLGRRVFTDRRLAVRGQNTYRFRGLSDAGTPLPSGTYFYRVTSGPSIETGRMTIVR